VGDFGTIAADFERCFAGTTGVVVSGIAPVGAAGVDCGGVGDVGEQSEGEVLCVDGRGEEAVGGGDGCVGEVDGGGGEGFEDSVKGVAWVWRGAGARDGREVRPYTEEGSCHVE